MKEKNTNLKIWTELQKHGTKKVFVLFGSRDSKVSHASFDFKELPLDNKDKLTETINCMVISVIDGLFKESNNEC